MSVLIDTSVWSDHFRRQNLVLAGLIVLDQVLTHPMIFGDWRAARRQNPNDVILMLNHRHSNIVPTSSIVDTMLKDSDTPRYAVRRTKRTYSPVTKAALLGCLR
jgi:hypothetical protein